MPIETLEQRLFRYWRRVQDWLDVRGDVVMLGWTGAVVYKVLHGGLNAADAVAYSAAVGAFGYTKGKQNGTTIQASSSYSGPIGPTPTGAPLR